MFDSMEFEKKEKKYIISRMHVAIICATVVVCSLAVGLGVGLSRPASPTSPPATSKPTSPTTSRPTEQPTTTQTTVKPTERPTPPPEPPRGPCLPSEQSGGDWKNFRLPDYINPVHYDLHLEPNMDDDTYSGTVDIEIELTRRTNNLWLHIRETFVSALPRLRRKNGPSLRVVECFEYKKHEFVVVLSETSMKPGSYVLSLDFKGVLTGSVVGFYRVLYNEGGETKKIAATDHQPTDARKSFPCFDEPNKKATYTVSITHDPAYKALSNMPQEGPIQTLPGNKVKTSFMKSVPMSTYLVCFAVHKFDFVERTSARGIPLKIWAQPSQLHTAEYAANTTKIIFDYFEEYFNMSYSISKLDKIAIPNFGTGAMENWGLITYREANLLYDENESSSSNKQRVASVIAHELVHQWFGNIVTMDWWDDLWLNEGFASFFEFVGVEKAEPDWGMRDIMIISDVLPVMEDDALLSSHPIIVEVSTPAEITSVFDSISYNKGASILRMLENWMGKDLFRDGCRQYLKDYHFKNAKTANFWASLAAVSGLPIADVMDTWTKQMGYPVLTLSITGTEANLTQRRFLLDPNADVNQPPTELGYKWTMPVEFHAITSNRNFVEMFNRTQAELVISGYSSAEGLLKVNNDHIGFFRVNHDDLMWTSISQQLLTDHTEFDAGDRASFIDDVFALSRGDLIEYGNAFNLTQYLKIETEYIVWKSVANSIAYVRTMLSSNSGIYPKFQTLFRDHVKDIASRLGWNDVGDQKTRLLRETVLGIACQMGDTAALDEASRLFNQWINGTLSSVAVNLRSLVYRYGMKRDGSEDKWNKMFERYTTEPLAQEKDKLLYGLASVENIDLLYRLLEAGKDENIVNSQDLFTLIRYVSYNPLGQSMAWDWTTFNWEFLVERYTINDRYFGRLVSDITTSYNTELQLWRMENFFRLTPNAGAGEMPRTQAIETVKNNIEWMRRNQDEIKLWLDNNVVTREML